MVGVWFGGGCFIIKFLEKFVAGVVVVEEFEFFISIYYFWNVEVGVWFEVYCNWSNLGVVILVFFVKVIDFKVDVVNNKIGFCCIGCVFIYGVCVKMVCYFVNCIVFIIILVLDVVVDIGYNGLVGYFKGGVFIYGNFFIKDGLVGENVVIFIGDVLGRYLCE